MNKPFSQACENNKDAILAILASEFSTTRRVLEIGSGTGQHGAHFAPNLPHLLWQPSDRAENLPGIRLWRNSATAPNLAAPIELDVTRQWPDGPFDGLFSANTAHIMPWPAVEQMLEGAGQLLSTGGRFCLYGPFHYGGKPTSASNARFDAFLRAQDQQMGIRDFEAVCEVAAEHGLHLTADHTMPANNRLLVLVRG
ncbi:DUF938 domain-containing protein [Ferrimonas balearica]|uniref:DUF938 domain-containing protein n=1 Tax=Ferrimonas balearica TaxID=44012 RepID=UPI001C5BE331|nr:DUF938 domain-containing protein [Ferrimonas balearica]MBW3166522.1 DUF938 domain-containing protein [Ferrimonas balearica]